MLEESKYTSVKQRIDKISSKLGSSQTSPIKLAQFIGASQTEDGIAFSLKNHLALTDWTCADKSGYIEAETPKILEQLGLMKQPRLKQYIDFQLTFIPLLTLKNNYKRYVKNKRRNGCAVCIFAGSYLNQRNYALSLFDASSLQH